MNRAALATTAVGLLLVACALPYSKPSVHVTTTEATTTTQPTTTTTTEAPFVTLVASPFSKTELDYLNALIVANLDPGADAMPGTRLSAEGVDDDGDGRTDRGWHDLDLLNDYSTAVLVGRMLFCDPEFAVRLPTLDLEKTGRSTQEWEQYLVITQAYLC